MKTKKDIISEIKSIDVSNRNNVIASNRGLCRYNYGEDYDIRCAKYDKIIEAINFDKNRFLAS